MADIANRCGVLYVATQQEKYLVEAKASAISLKRHCPHLEVSLFTDLPDSRHSQASCFDSVSSIHASAHCVTEWGRGLLTKVLSLAQSPYERTCFVDTDTRFLSGGLSQQFSLLDECDIALVVDPPSDSIAVRHYDRPMFNTGVILFRKNDKVLKLLKEWERLFLLQLAAQAEDPMPSIPYMNGIQNEHLRRKLLANDQFALAQLLSPETNVLDLNINVLDEAWNFCGTFAGRTLDRPIHIEHGLHLKADAFTRTVHRAKTHSLNELTMKLVNGLARSYVELASGFNEECLATLAKTIQAVPNQGLIQVPLAKEMLRLKRTNEACRHAEQAILADPENYLGFVELATARFNQGDIDGAADCVVRCRSRFPHQLGIMGIAQVIQAQGGKLGSWAEPNYDAFLLKTRLELEPTLNQWLQDFIVHQSLLETEPPERTPRNFYRSAALGGLAGPSLAAFKNALRPAIQQYLDHVSQHNHPFVAARPSKMGIACWGTVQGRNAYMAPHIHRNAWISGVFYLRIPESVHESQQEHAGWIEFGRPPKDDFAYTFEPSPLTIEPEDGMLLLFPAHAWHGTVPHGSDELRLSFGFNVLPSSERSS